MKKKKEYAVGEVFRHTDGKLYRCVEIKICKGCAFKYLDMGCLYGLNCRSTDREDGRSVKFIAVTEPAEGMLFRAENGRMYRLTQGSHWDHQCACDGDNSLSCGALDTIVFGGALLGWYWSPVEEDATSPVDPPKSVEPPKSPEPSKRHIELSVVGVEGDKVTFRIVEQTHRCDGFSRQDHPRVFKAANGFNLRSAGVPEWLPLDDQWCVWANLNDESSRIAALRSDMRNVQGADSIEYKVETLTGFARGSVKELVSKPKIAGMGMNFQRIHRCVFIGLSDSFEQYYQAVRRFWRFGQIHPVDVYIVTADTEGAVVENIKRKEREANQLYSEMSLFMREINVGEIRATRRNTTDYNPEESMTLPVFLKGA